MLDQGYVIRHLLASRICSGHQRCENASVDAIGFGDRGRELALDLQGHVPVVNAS